MFGFFKKNKGPFTATISPIGKSFQVKGISSENLLKAALENGIDWPYSCRVGSCGTCRCKLVSGKIKPLNDFSYVLSDEELDQGYILACQTMLQGDIEVELPLNGSAVQLAKARRIAGKIAGIKQLTHDIQEIEIELEKEFKDYLPGQYAEIMVPGVIEQARSYSFSKSPVFEEGNQVSFFIRHVPNGTFTDWLHSGNRMGERVVLHGPHGTFYLREPEGAILMVAGGSGLAPIRALMQQIADKALECDVTLIFGARTQKDLYCLDEINELGARIKGRFNFVPVLSMEQPENGWNGATGHCPEAIVSGLIEPATGHAYLCGPPVMVDAAVARLKSLGMGSDRIFFDKFLDASSMPGGRA